LAAAAIFSSGAESQKVTVAFPRLKQAKSSSNQLPAKTSQALLDYLHAYYGEDLSQLAQEAPIWVTLTGDRFYGKPMSIRTIQRISERLCQGNFHKLRATFAVAMERSGAKVSEIQAKLGHESLATTGRYLARLHNAENVYGSEMEKLFGME
jgi:integrase